METLLVLIFMYMSESQCQINYTCVSHLGFDVMKNKVYRWRNQSGKSETVLLDLLFKNTIHMEMSRISERVTGTSIELIV